MNPARMAIGLCALLAIAPLPTASAQAPTPNVDLQVSRSQPVADGKPLGPAGAYEKVVGTLRFAVDPADPRNAGIVDLDLAPRNARGLVEYETDFYLLRPRDLARWNGKLLFDVNNRGRKLIFQGTHDGGLNNDPTDEGDFGNGFLLEQGYALAWTGWEGDIAPGQDRLTIRLPVPRNADGTQVTQRIVTELHDTYLDTVSGQTKVLPIGGGPEYQGYAADLSQAASAELRARPSDSPRPSAPRIPAGELVPRDRWRFLDESRIRLDRGFRDKVYELSYVAKDPRVMGLGYAATRDAISFLRHAEADADGTPNPLRGGGGRVRHVLGVGVSQSGRYLRDYIYQGFNEDTAGRKVFDGTFIYIASATKLGLNYRFAQPNPSGQQHANRYTPDVGFPFNYGVRRNPVAALTRGPAQDGILKRPRTDPLVIHADTSTEYWQYRAALVGTDGFGNDVPLPRTVRQYLVAGVPHYVGKGEEPVRDRCQQAINPTHGGPAMRALLDALDRWVTRGTRPPPSRRPTVANRGLVGPDQRATGFPRIPGVTYNGVYNAVAERDFGPRVSQNRGIIDLWGHPRDMREYRVLVPRVDRVGIDRFGLEVPEVATPSQTLTGWGLRDDGFTEGDLCDLDGQSIPLSRDLAERRRTRDPRPSLEDLYGDRAGYLRQVRRDTRKLVKQRLLLPADARLAIQEAKQGDVLGRAR